MAFAKIRPRCQANPRRSSSLHDQIAAATKLMRRIENGELGPF